MPTKDRTKVLPDRWAIINKDYEVVNVVIWNGPATEWCPPRGHIVTQCAMEVGIGHKFDPETKRFTRPSS